MQFHISKKYSGAISILLAAAMILTACTRAATPQGPPTSMLVPATTGQTIQGPFLLSNLTVTPNTIRLFNWATVTVVVTNKGKEPGIYTAVLNVHTSQIAQGVTILPSSTQPVTLAPGESTTVTWNVSVMGNGTHIVSVDGLWERLAVDSQI